MRKELEVDSIINQLRTAFNEKFLTEDGLRRWLVSYGVKGEVVGYFLKALLLNSDDASDGMEAFFAEKSVRKILVSDDCLRDSLGELVSLPARKFVVAIRDTISNGKQRIFSLELSGDGKYWHILLNDNKFLQGKDKGGDSYWEHIFDIAKNNKSEVAGGKDQGMGIVKWFNSNSSNPIYKIGFKKTKLLCYKSDFIYPEDGILIKELSKRKLDKFRRLARGE